MTIWEEYEATPSSMTPSTISLSQFKFFQEDIISFFSDTYIKNIFENLQLTETRILKLDNEISMFGDSRIRNVFEISKPSDTRILDTFDILKTIDTRILQPDNLIFKTSDGAIHQPAWDTKEKISDSSILNIIDITKSSDTTLVIVREEVRRSNSIIFYPEYDTKQLLSDTIIFQAEYGLIDKFSESRILRLQMLEKDSSSWILSKYEKIKNSDSAIYRSVFDIKTLTSETRIGYEDLAIIDILSDSRIVNTLELTTLSDSFIVLNFDVLLDSNSAIFSPAFGNRSLESDSRIQVINKEIPIYSETNITDTNTITILSDSRVKRIAGYTYPYMTIKIPSDTRLIKTLIKELKSTSDILDIFVITSLSDTLIILQPKIDLLSDTNIIASQQITLDVNSNITKKIETAIHSNSVVEKMYELLINSNTLINQKNTIQLEASSIVSKTIEFTVVSNTSIEIKNDLNIISDATMYNEGYGLIEKTSLAYITKTHKKDISSLSRTLNIGTTSVASDTYIRKRLGKLDALFRKRR